VGWLVVEDLTMVFALVLLPAVAPMLSGADATTGTETGPALAASVGLAVGKVAVFVALMAVVGRRFVPWLLARVARLESRELFTLAVLVTALGVGALAAELFGVSFALGAFFAGVVVSESELSHRAAAEALPMQDAFAVLFFVSAGMLFDPAVLVRHPGQVAALVAIVVLWKSALASGLLVLLGQPARSAFTVGAALGQIGEFSFMVAALGVTLGLMSRDGQALVIAAALVSIALNGPLLSAVARVAQWLADRAAASAVGEAARTTRELRAAAPPPPASGSPGTAAPDPSDFSDLTGHVVLVGYGRVGATVAEALGRSGARHVVVEEQDRVVAGLADAASTRSTATRRAPTCWSAPGSRARGCWWSRPRSRSARAGSSRSRARRARTSRSPSARTARPSRRSSRTT
jgi:CPA2 family monovalent cation:H+ antiporter-2